MSTHTENGVIYSFINNNKEVLVGVEPYESAGNAISPTLDHTDIFIPEIICSKKVTTIAVGAFQFNKEITSISVPCTVTIIKQDAFSHMTQLVNITFRGASQVRELGRGVFFNDPNLKYLELPPKIETMGIYCFGNNKLDILVYCGRYIFNDIIIFKLSDNVTIAEKPSKIIVSNYYLLNEFGTKPVIHDSFICPAMLTGQFLKCTRKKPLFFINIKMISINFLL